MAAPPSLVFELYGILVGALMSAEKPKDVLGYLL
jgi:hypothetical protein